MKNEKRSIKLFTAYFFTLLGLSIMIISMLNPTAVNVSASVADNSLSKMSQTYGTTPEGKDFADDTVVVVLTQEATNQFLHYRTSDFAEVNACAVDDLTASAVDWVSKQMRNISTQEKMLVNTEKFRRILSIKLSEPSRENVLKAIDIIKRRSDVQSASPSYFIGVLETANDTQRSNQWGLNSIRQILLETFRQELLRLLWVC